ncbi:hypothetical protein BGZ83_004006 [Gryganskiella cystojenkinii]|nr:hypothetical protein BGZ83_004006 [Gryganskiella cystojenkinii]
MKLSASPIDLRKRQLAHLPPVPALAAPPPAESQNPKDPGPILPTPHPKPTSNPLPPITPQPDPSPSPKPEPTTPHPPQPPPQPKPSPNNPAPAPHPSPAPSPSKAAHSSSSDSASSSLPTPSSDLPQPSGSPNSDDDGNGVPTKVSDKVFIGLGTVGGLLVFALGGVAFCRHRRKKNLATALLQQTAQFNHNNPYAKISDKNGGKKDPYQKESHAMTPTKPIGTFGVVATYTPALADEIELCLGDSVTISQEYDDGWCMGVNNTRGGIKGVFPRHCLEGQFDHTSQSQYGGGGGYGGEELGYYPPNPGFKAMANKRMSSIPSQGWGGSQAGGYTPGGAYGDYPPAPQYHHHGNNMGPPSNHGGYYQGGY